MKLVVLSAGWKRVLCSAIVFLPFATMAQTCRSFTVEFKLSVLDFYKENGLCKRALLVSSRLSLKEYESGCILRHNSDK